MCAGPALIAKGLSPGAALVFLLVGPATNLATMVVVARDLGGRSLLLYLVSIVVVAVLCGLGADLIIDSAAWHGAVAKTADPSPFGTWSQVCALGLAVLMLNGLWRRFGRPIGRQEDSITPC